VDYVLRPAEGPHEALSDPASGANPVLLSASLDVRATPVVVSGRPLDRGERRRRRGAGLSKVAADGGSPERLGSGLYFQPVWSPDGQFIVYAEDDASGTLRVRAMTPEGDPFPLPEFGGSYVWDAYRFVQKSVRFRSVATGVAGSV
jgi:hypothetical protein